MKNFGFTSLFLKKCLFVKSYAVGSPRVWVVAGGFWRFGNHSDLGGPQT